MNVKGFCAYGAVARLVGADQNALMARSEAGHFIRAWRKHRGLTLEQLAERVGMTHQNLGKIERGKVPYSQPLLEALAEELRTDPASLIMRDPEAIDPIYSLWDTLSPVQQTQAVEVIKALKRTGTDN